MVKRRSTTKTYQLWLEADIHSARGLLPGNVRQRIKRLFTELAEQPRPPSSNTLDTGKFDLPAGVEIRRIRLEKWRIIYAINDHNRWVWVLAIRQRPPYDYEDLPEMIAKLTE